MPHPRHQARSRRPSGENRIPEIMLPSRGHAAIRRPVAASQRQTRAVLAARGDHAAVGRRPGDARGPVPQRRPGGLRGRDIPAPAPGHPRRRSAAAGRRARPRPFAKSRGPTGGPIGRPVPASQIRAPAVGSKVRMQRPPSAAKPTANLLGAASSGRRGGRSAGSQVRTRPPKPPVSTRRPSAANATHRTPAAVGQRRPERPAGRRVPQPCRAVVAAGQHGAAVGAERDGVDGAADARRSPAAGAPIPPTPTGWPGSVAAAPAPRAAHRRRASAIQSIPRSLSPAAGQLQPAVEVAGGDLGLGAGTQLRLGLPRLGLGGGQLLASASDLAARSPADGPRRASPRRARHDHQPGQQPGRQRVAPAPPRRPLARPDAPRPDRPVLEEPPQVIGQLGGRRVPPRRLPRHRLEHDRLQVARQPRVELPRPGRVLVAARG